LTARITKFSQLALDRMLSITKETGEVIDFNYPGNAGKTDPVYERLPSEARQRLKEVAYKYDPDAAFQRLVPGYKL